jgi:hypothetical protein
VIIIGNWVLFVCVRVGMLLLVLLIGAIAMVDDVKEFIDTDERIISKTEVAITTTNSVSAR